MRKKKSVNLFVSILVLSFLISLTTIPSYANDGTFVGEIQVFPYGFAPIEWLPCDGRSLQINDNSTLFALIGTKFGGDGISTFNLPDLRGMEPKEGVKYCIAMEGPFPLQDGGWGNEMFIGQIVMFPFSRDTSGFMRCDGRILQINQYNALFSLIGTNYGGDGVNNFKIPDMRKMNPNKDIWYFINTNGIYPPRN